MAPCGLSRTFRSLFETARHGATLGVIGRPALAASLFCRLPTRKFAPTEFLSTSFQGFSLPASIIAIIIRGTSFSFSLIPSNYCYVV